MAEIYRVVLVLCIIYQTQAGFPEYYKELHKNAHDVCVAETGVTEDLIQKAINGDFSEDHSLKCFFKCLYEHYDLVLPDGHFKIEEIIKLIPPEMDHIYEPMVRNCGTVVGDDPCDTAYKTNICYYNQNNEHYDIV